MAKTLRVHNLAKELGIDSREIIAKCKAEGIELANHMAVVKLGLAESIREWFSTAQDVTSVEQAAPVDLTKVKKRAPRKRTKEEEAAEAAGAVITDTATDSDAESETDEHEEAHVEIAADAESAPAPVIAPIVEPVASAAAAAEIASAPTPVVESISVPEPTVAPRVAPPAPALPAEPTPERIAASAEATVERVEPLGGVRPSAQPPAPAVLAPAAHASNIIRTPTGRIAVPPPTPAPTPVRPAGPQLVPKPAELQGPRVVRIEAPEPSRPPRPRPSGFGPGGPGGMGGPRPPVGGGPPSAPGGPPRPREGVKKPEDERELLKVRARSPRRNASDDVFERMKEWRDQDVLERKERLAHVTGQGIRARRTAEIRRQAGPGSGGGAAAGGKRADITIVAPIMLKDFCAAVGTPFRTVSAKLMEHSGTLYRINDSIDAETVELLAMELGLSLDIERALTAYERIEADFEERERPNLKSRPPVCAMLGHVDHGKTSLLDAIRKTHVAKGEAGGITQHIGAYRIDRGDWHVTFLDTPGHQAFTAMRARGANLTDVVVLVVAADDGVMPQTVEALAHARAAGVQIVVALNKIDLPGVDVNKVYGQLAEHELVPTEWGGTIDVVKTSAAKGTGVDELIAHLSTLSELLDLKADPSVPAHAVVIESQMKEGRGPVAQVLVREGTLKVGQFVVCGPAHGRVRSLLDDRGRRVTEAAPATPVEVVGLDALPAAGDKLFVVSTLAEAKEIATEVAQKRREEALFERRKPRTLEDLLRGGEEAELPLLNVILKADVQGSLESLKAEFGKFPAEKARMRMLHAGIGMITEADVALARASEALVIGFNVVAEDRARDEADEAGVQIRTYRVIYEIVDDLHKALRGLLEPERRAEVRGKAEIRQIFNLSKVGVIAGCLVVDGTINRGHRVRVVRDGRIVLENAELASLKRVKDDAREVRSGLECGIKIAGFDDLKPGDVIETFEVIESEQQL